MDLTKWESHDEPHDGGDPLAVYRGVLVQEVDPEEGRGQDHGADGHLDQPGKEVLDAAHVETAEQGHVDDQAHHLSDRGDPVVFAHLPILIIFIIVIIIIIIITIVIIILVVVIIIIIITSSSLSTVVVVVVVVIITCQ